MNIFSCKKNDDVYKFVIMLMQGGIDEGEDPRNAAIRELREETGVTSAEIIAEVQILYFWF